MDIKNKVAIVTGGTRGIGYSIVHHLLKNEAQYVAIFDKFQNDDDQVSGSLQKLGQDFDEMKFDYYMCDVTNSKQFEANYIKVIKFREYVDILINNAGVVDEKNFNLTIDVNFRAVVQGTMTAIDNMSKGKGYKGGVVVNIASFLGLINAPLCPVYNATKHAVVSYVRSMKTHNEKLGMRIVCVCPGMTETNMITFENLLGSSFMMATDKEVSETLNIYIQKPDNVASAVTEIIVKGKGGDVWVAKDDKPPFNVGEEEDLNKMRIPF